MSQNFNALWLLLIAMACSRSTTTEQYVSINFDQLIDEQIRMLGHHRDTLQKEAIVDKQLSDSIFVPSPEIWKNELDIFRQLQTVNKTIHRGAFRPAGPLDDPRSNLQVQQYTSDTAPLRLLRVYYQESIDHVRRIEAVLGEPTQVYTNRQELSMEFEEEDGKLLLVSYGVTGFQKVALRDTVRFSLYCRIRR